MLLDELVAERDRAQTPPAPEPELSVEPMPVPLAPEVTRRNARQRLAELESAARHNFKSAEEARRVLHEEHERLQAEATARGEAEREVTALRRELERLRDDEAQRATKAKTRAERAARAEIANELKRFHDEHERVQRELDQARGVLSEHDSLLDEYTARLRDEQNARALLRGELDRAEAARNLAERALEAATENARRRNEDEAIRLATAEQELADAKSDRDRLAARIAELTEGGDSTADELGRAQVRIADLEARIDATEEAAQAAISARDEAVAELANVRTELSGSQDAEARINELEERYREAQKNQGRMRREASEAASRRRGTEQKLEATTAERDELRARTAQLEAELVRARADSDQLREHAAALGDELAVVRGTVAELQAAAPAPVATSEANAEPEPDPALAPEREPEQEPVVAQDAPPPLPLRIAGRHAPAPDAGPLVRRSSQAVPPAASTTAPPLPRRSKESFEESSPSIADDVEPQVASVEPEPATERAPDGGFRRSAMAELTAIATLTDDFTYRRR